jgi:exosortase C (VPDSG-CTERM-specific)
MGTQLPDISLGNILEIPSSIDRAVATENESPTEAGSVAGSTHAKKKKMWRIWMGAAFAIALLGVFAQPLLALTNYAAGSDLSSYILLIPFVSAYLLYVRRNHLPTKYHANIPLGVVLLATGLGIFLLVHWLNLARRAPADNSYFVLVVLSLLCCLAAGGFFFLGGGWMRAAAFPLAYLVFMVPMPDAMANALESASKYASAEVANVLFQLSGTPFLREGLIFQLPNITIEVAQECSGIRSSWVLLMTSILAANLFLKGPWRRLVLVALVIPLAILRNGFRILVIGLLCVNLGPQMIHSIIHRRGGPLFFVLSLIPLLLLLGWLHKGEARSRSVTTRRIA